MRLKVRSAPATQPALGSCPHIYWRAHTPLHRLQIVSYPPNSLRRLLDCWMRRCSWCACGTASRGMSEHAEPFLLRPDARPQASARRSSRCLAWSSSASTSCSWPCGCRSASTPARRAAAAVAAAAARWRRVRRLRTTGRAHAAGRRQRRPSGGARWSRTRPGLEVTFCPLLRKSSCSGAWCARVTRG